MGDVVPTTLCQGCYVVHLYDVCPLPTLSTSRLPGHGYWLDTYYWTYTMPGSARTHTSAMVPLSRQQPQEEHQGQGIREVYQVWVPYLWFMIPVHILDILPMVSTGPLLLNFSHADSPSTHTWAMDPLAGSNHRRSTRAKVLEKSTQFEFHIYDVCFPIHIQGCLLMFTEWTPTTGCIWYKAQPGPAQEP